MKEAVRYYRLATDLTHSSVSLGFCYHNGAGVPKDMKEAVHVTTPL